MICSQTQKISLNSDAITEQRDIRLQNPVFYKFSIRNGIFLIRVFVISSSLSSTLYWEPDLYNAVDNYSIMFTVINFDFTGMRRHSADNTFYYSYRTTNDRTDIAI